MEEFMNSFIHRNLIKSTFSILIILIALSACQRSHSKKLENSMTELTPRLQSVFEKTRKICFGRFLIEIPSTATVIYGPTEVEAPIIYYQNEAAKLMEHLANRMAEVEQERDFFFRNEATRFPMFGKVIDGIIPGQKISYGSKDRVSYDIYSYVPVSKDLFVFQFTAFPEDDEIPIINQIAKHLRTRSADEIPAGPGFCIEGGFIPLEQKYERATIGIRLKEFPDTHISIDVHKNLQYLPEGNSPKLLREQAKNSAEANGLGAVFAHTKILRQQARTLERWAGEEQALRTPAYKDNKSVHEFRFHSAGAVDDRFYPEIDIRFDSGLKENQKARVSPILTDEEALALWDKVITSIRLRQSSDATPAKEISPKIPFAGLMRTGEPCSQTGWWECTESERIQGENRRFLKAGESMPFAPLIGEPGLWQKLTNTHSVRQSATVWKLVEDADAPTASPAAG
jgi:hypothetical protein